MKHDRFAELIKELDGDSAETLINKNKMYSSEDNALHNFNDGAEILGGTAADACWGYLTKHLVALRDMVKRNDFSNREDFKEKCQDSINYIRILWAIGNEVDDGISEHDRGLLRDIVESLGEKETTYCFEDIVFNSYVDACEVLSAINDTIECYGQASVADLYGFSSKPATFWQYNYIGWKDIRDAKIKQHQPSGFIIEFASKPIYL